MKIIKSTPLGPFLPPRAAPPAGSPLAGYLQGVSVRVPRYDVLRGLDQLRDRISERIGAVTARIRPDLESIGLGDQADSLIDGLLDRDQCVHAIEAIQTAFDAAWNAHHEREANSAAEAFDGAYHGSLAMSAPLPSSLPSVPSFSQVCHTAVDLVGLGGDARMCRLMAMRLDSLESEGSTAGALVLDLPAATMLLGERRAR